MLHRIGGSRYDLSQLLEDPQEAVDVSTSPDHAPRFERMRTELDAWMLSVMRTLNGEDSTPSSR